MTSSTAFSHVNAFWFHAFGYISFFNYFNKGLILKALILVCGIFLSSNVVAEQCDYYDERKKCVVIEHAEFKQADDKLNTLYKVALSNLKVYEQNNLKYGSYLKHFVGSQKAWLTFRNKHCGFISGNDTDNVIGEQIEWNKDCMAELTESRNIQLEKIISQFK